jgi:hypothetical protein
MGVGEDLSCTCPLPFRRDVAWRHQDVDPPGTTIISDCYAAYVRLGDEGFTHHTLTHRVVFVNVRTALTPVLQRQPENM